MPAELSGVICSSIVFLPHVYVMCMCVYVNVVACLEILLDGADRVFCINNNNNNNTKHFLALTPAGAESDLNDPTNGA